MRPQRRVKHGRHTRPAMPAAACLLLSVVVPLILAPELAPPCAASWTSFSATSAAPSPAQESETWQELLSSVCGPLLPAHLRGRLEAWAGRGSPDLVEDPEQSTVRDTPWVFALTSDGNWSADVPPEVEELLQGLGPQSWAWEAWREAARAPAQGTGQSRPWEKEGELDEQGMKHGRMLQEHGASQPQSGMAPVQMVAPPLSFQSRAEVLAWVLNHPTHRMWAVNPGLSHASQGHTSERKMPLHISVHGVTCSPGLGKLCIADGYLKGADKVYPSLDLWDKPDTPDINGPLLKLVGVVWSGDDEQESDGGQKLEDGPEKWHVNDGGRSSLSEGSPVPLSKMCMVAHKLYETSFLQPTPWVPIPHGRLLRLLLAFRPPTLYLQKLARLTEETLVGAAAGLAHVIQASPATPAGSEQGERGASREGLAYEVDHSFPARWLSFPGGNRNHISYSYVYTQLGFMEHAHRLAPAQPAGLPAWALDRLLLLMGYKYPAFKEQGGCAPWWEPHRGSLGVLSFPATWSHLREDGGRGSVARGAACIRLLRFATKKGHCLWQDPRQAGCRNLLPQDLFWETRHSWGPARLRDPTCGGSFYAEAPEPWQTGPAPLPAEQAAVVEVLLEGVEGAEEEDAGLGRPMVPTTFVAEGEYSAATGRMVLVGYPGMRPGGGSTLYPGSSAGNDSSAERRFVLSLQFPMQRPALLQLWLGSGSVTGAIVAEEHDGVPEAGPPVIELYSTSFLTEEGLADLVAALKLEHVFQVLLATAPVYLYVLQIRFLKRSPEKAGHISPFLLLHLVLGPALGALNVHRRAPPSYSEGSDYGYDIVSGFYSYDLLMDGILPWRRQPSPHTDSPFPSIRQELTSALAFPFAVIQLLMALRLAWLVYKARSRGARGGQEGSGVLELQALLERRDMEADERENAQWGLSLAGHQGLAPSDISVVSQIEAGPAQTLTEPLLSERERRVGRGGTGRDSEGLGRRGGLWAGAAVPSPGVPSSSTEPVALLGRGPGSAQGERREGAEGGSAKGEGHDLSQDGTTDSGRGTWQAQADGHPAARVAEPMSTRLLLLGYLYLMAVPTFLYSVMSKDPFLVTLQEFWQAFFLFPQAVAILGDKECGECFHLAFPIGLTLFHFLDLTCPLPRLHCADGLLLFMFVRHLQ